MPLSSGTPEGPAERVGSAWRPDSGWLPSASQAGPGEQSQAGRSAASRTLQSAQRLAKVPAQTSNNSAKRRKLRTAEGGAAEKRMNSGRINHRHHRTEPTQRPCRHASKPDRWRGRG